MQRRLLLSLIYERYYQLYCSISAEEAELGIVPHWWAQIIQRRDDIDIRICVYLMKTLFDLIQPFGIVFEEFIDMVFVNKSDYE